MMTPATANNALQFLARVDLKGNEAPAMMEVVQALTIVVQSGQQPQNGQDAPDVDAPD